MENERTRLQREKHSSDQRLLSMETLFANKENEHQVQVKKLMNRAFDAEAQLDASLSAQQDFKREIELQTSKLLELQASNKEMDDAHSKAIDKLQNELLCAKREHDNSAVQISMLESKLETTRRECQEEKEKMMVEVEKKIQETQIENEAIKASRSNDQRIAKEAQSSYDKAISLHQSTIDRMKIESKDVRMELEKLICEERSVNQVSEGNL